VPEILNTDQGYQFTSNDWINAVKGMPSKDGRCLDNVFIERLCHSVKHGDNYLHDYSSIAAACAGLRQ
jgi:putative transposase